MCILVAEDDPVSRMILRKQVEREGHVCIVADSGEEAWVLYQANMVDVIISDWVMPGMTGVDLCRRIRDELILRLMTAERVTSLHRQLLAQKIELEHLNRQLHRQGRRDALTGLRNRLCLREDLEMLCDRSQRYGHTYGLAMVDIDHFKRCNDRYGHPAEAPPSRT